jgi:ketol-acid reductoisomerase
MLKMKEETGMSTKYTQSTEYLSKLQGKTIAILGYSEIGQEEAANLRSNGINVLIGLRPIDDEWDLARNDGFSVKTLEEAVEDADVIQVW